MSNLKGWHECKPGNMPEDILPDSYECIDKCGRIYYNYIIISDYPISIYDVKPWEFGCRVQRKNKTRFTWCGSHPRYWRLSSLAEYKKIRMRYYNMTHYYNRR